MEGLNFYFSLSVCVSVCLCVRISCEQNSSLIDAPINTGSDPTEIDDLGSKVKVTVTQ